MRELKRALMWVYVRLLAIYALGIAAVVLIALGSWQAACGCVCGVLLIVVAPKDIMP